IKRRAAYDVPSPLGRNVYAGAGAESAARLADYALRARSGLAEQSLKTVLARPAWAEVVA
ncbi:MAG: ubiquinol-cytochrome C chaperone, partial [Brevundimonas sp.]